MLRELLFWTEVAMLTRTAGVSVVPAHVLWALVLAFGLASWTPALAQERGTATEDVKLYESPPRRVFLFPYLVRPSGEPHVLNAGTEFVVLDDEERNDFFRQPSRWLFVRTDDGLQGWIDDADVVTSTSTPSSPPVAPPHSIPEPN